jgi:hypoxanthine phosphoribosyltransferase
MLDAPALAGLKVLLVDDVSDSGHTLALVDGILRESAGEVRTATLYTKPRTVHVPDFTWRETDDWIIFPWSALPPVTATPLTTVVDA